MATKIQVRRGTASQWTTSNPVLSEGELGFETDTGKFKIGDGSDNWSTLAYAGGSETLEGIDNVYESNLAENDYLYYKEGIAGVKATGSLGQDDLIIQAKDFGTASNGVFLFVNGGSQLPGISHTGSAGDWIIQVDAQGQYTWEDVANYINQQAEFEFIAISSTQFSVGEGGATLSGGVDEVAAGWYNQPIPVRSVNSQTGEVFLNTDSISESTNPTNLYFTNDRADARARAVISAGISPLFSIGGS